MSLPTIFEYMPEQARDLCEATKTAAHGPGWLIRSLTRAQSLGPESDTDSSGPGDVPSKEKKAEEPRAPGEKAKSVAKTIGTGLLGFGAGSLAGAGGAMLLDKWHEAATGQKIPIGTLFKAAPLVGGAFGLAYNIYKARELEELRHALESKSDRTQGRVSPK